VVAKEHIHDGLGDCECHASQQQPSPISEWLHPLWANAQEPLHILNDVKGKLPASGFIVRIASWPRQLTINWVVQWVGCCGSVLAVDSRSFRLSS